MYRHSEEIAQGPARVRVAVVSAEPMDRVLEDTTFLDYRLGGVTRTLDVAKGRVDLFWDRTASEKKIAFRDDQLRLEGPWFEGELQRILVSLMARRMEEVGLYLFHSSAVHYRGRSILFMSGESNNGKTMSQIEARRRGAAFIATETTVINRAGQVVAGSREVFLRKRAKGTERADKPPQDEGVRKFFDALPDLTVFHDQPTTIDLVILPDIDGNFATAVAPLSDFEKAYQTFHCLMDYFALNVLLAPGLPMPILDTEELRARRAAFIRDFIRRPYYIIRSAGPQSVLDEVEKLL